MAFIVATAFDYRWLKTFAWPLYVLQLGLLVLTLAIGDGVGGSARWVDARPADVPVQRARQDPDDHRPRELPRRPARHARLARRRSSGACLLVGPPLVLVMLQPDLGTSLVFGGDPRRHAVHVRREPQVAARPRPPAVIAIVPIAWTYVLRDYQKAAPALVPRPGPDIQGAGYQLYQAQIAVGSGGLVGKGLTNGTQAAGRLPAGPDHRLRVRHPRRGARVHRRRSSLFVLFVLLLWRILVAGWRSRDPFGTMFAAGVASMILFQLVVNVGMVIGIMPITGIPLPFVTHGGASLVSLALGLGILQSINIRQTRAEW